MPSTTIAESSIVIMSTDLGYDPDDIVALALAAKVVKYLVVITADETQGRRARLARLLLDEMDRQDVPVIAGKDLGGVKRFVLDGTLADVLNLSGDNDVVGISTDVIDMVSDIAATSTEPVVWVGEGPMSDLADVLIACPELTEQLSVTQMGGWLDSYRDMSRASHNFRLDPRAAGLALRALHRPRLVLSDYTNVPEIRITAESELYRDLAASEGPTWKTLVRANFERWFEQKPGCWLHDPLTLAAALGLPVVEFATERVRVEGDARLYRDPDGRAVQVAKGADYAKFWEWMEDVMGSDTTGVLPVTDVRSGTMHNFSTP